MNNILITGVSGYLGKQLVKRFRARNDIGCIVGIDIVPPAWADESLIFYPRDIRDPAIGEVMARHGIDTIFHFAFVVKPIHDLKRMHDIDFNGTLNVLEHGREHQVQQVIATSSTLAYGAHADNPEVLAEEAPLRGNKTFPYGYHKALTDKMMQDFAQQHSDITLTILRPCTVFGPSVDNYISRMLFLPVAVSVMGCNPRVQFVHETDVINACVKAMQKQKPGVFNITGDGALTIRQIADIIGTRILPLPAWVIYPMLEMLWRLRCPGIEVNSGYLDYVRYPFIAGNDKAKRELNFNPEYDSRQTLEETVQRRQC